MHQPADRDALLVYDAPESLLAAAAPLLRARAAEAAGGTDACAVGIASARDEARLRALVDGAQALTAVAFAALPLAIAACFDAVALAQPAPAQAVAERPLEPADLRALRRFVAAEATAAGVAQERIADVTVAAHEVAANACMHGGGEAVMRVWAERDCFCCEVSDHGGGMDDPLAGLLAPPVTQPSGRGLWLARQLCDLVQLRTGAAGTTVRLQVALGAPAPAPPAFA
ncbi:ATP-binding protein [Conexibacter sp. JD483]|uniref:ATP-binding protein n=1 Tax=unclassified Conexibacter TaxID=2627773 RepID=UPI002723138F|nr:MULTISPECIES: ATP-binding protein [unclassified Conexibacter]MDO8188906.1 ATP-binding protein [Conexibacter sp. CPCC 205706]MDO8200261.1 ATP-binding protein [Conexibacter sp. CPCC 205762]MDR9371618.1 ATP-binding protein [Conexibacter sp. JD483]